MRAWLKNVGISLVIVGILGVLAVAVWSIVRFVNHPAIGFILAALLGAVLAGTVVTLAERIPR